MVQNGTKRSKVVQNGTKRSKVVQNGHTGPNWSEMVKNCHNGHMVKNGLNGQTNSKWSKMVQNGTKWYKMVKVFKMFKMVNGQNGPNWSEMVIYGHNSQNGKNL